MDNTLYIVLVVVVVVVVGVIVAYWYVLGRAGRVAPEKLGELIKTGWRVVDVRTQEEYDDGHVPGAVLVDFYDSDFAKNIAKLDKSQKYVLYCKTGVRSRRAVRIMQRQGFANVCDVVGGYEDYKETAK